MSVIKSIESVMDRILLPNPRFQDYINNRFNSVDHTVIPTRFIKDMYYTHDNGLRFLLCDQMSRIIEVEDYDVRDLRPTDIVLDIGSCMGAFAMKVAPLVKWVFAVEPIYTDILKKNIEANGIRNITVFGFGLGTKDGIVRNGLQSKSVEMYRLSQILSMCQRQIGEPVTFLKIDCEGDYKKQTGEHCITSLDIDGLQAIEGEIHHFDGRPERSPFEDILDKAGFQYTKENGVWNSIMIHARKQI